MAVRKPLWDNSGVPTELDPAVDTVAGSDITTAVILLPTTSARNVIQPSGAAVIPLVVKGFAAQSANLQCWRDSADNVLTSISATGALGLGMLASANVKQSIKSINDLPTFGSELTASSGWTSTGWTGDYDTGFIHTPGNTTALSRAGTSGGSGTIYKILFTISGRTAGYFTIGFAGVTMGSYSTNGTYEVDPRGIATGVLTFTPESSFDGKISAISVKELTAPIPATKELYDANGNLSWEVRAACGSALAATYPNVYMGKNTGRYTTTGYANVGIGANALASVTIGSQHVAIGNQCLGAVDISTGNTGIGNGCMSALGSGGGNTAVGYYAGWNLLTGARNVALGWSALGGGGQTGTESTTIAIGYNTAATVLSGNGSVIIGAYAFANHASGDYNVILGQEAARNAVAGRTGANHNVAIGYQALYALETNQTGAVAIGYKAGLTCTSSNNIFMGKEADIVSTQRSNAVAIGYQAKVDQDNSLVLGVVGATSYLVGIGTTAPAAQFHAVCRSSTTIGMIVQGAVSQTANLQCWRDSSSAVLLAVTAAGRPAWNSAIAAPSTTLGMTFVNRYGGDTNALGDPTEWIEVIVNGNVRKIPCYA